MTERSPGRLRPDRIRLDGPAALVAAIPYLLGFHPAESVVVVGLGSGSHRVCLTVRQDLEPPEQDGTVAERLVGPLGSSGADRAIAVVVTTQGGDDPLPRSALVGRLGEVLPAAGIELDDAILVRDGRWWSYLCRDGSCCPASGHAVDPEPDGLLAAETVGQGRVVLPDRAALEEVVQPAPARDPAGRAAAFERAGRVLAAAIGRSGGAAAAREGVRAVLVAVRARAQAPAPLSTDEVARLCLLLALPAVRDRLLIEAGKGPPGGEAAEGLWLELVRRSPPGWAAAPATLLALQAYLRGDGAFARVCLERALRDDPGHPPALLLSAALDRAAPPQVVGRWARDGGLGGAGLSGRDGRLETGGPGGVAGADAARRAEGAWGVEGAGRAEGAGRVEGAVRVTESPP